MKKKKPSMSKNGHAEHAEQTELSYFPKRILVFWEVIAVLLAGGLCIAALLILTPHTIVWYAVLWLIGAVYVLAAFGYFPIAYINYRLGVFDRYLIVKSGVFMENTKFLYRDKVCYTIVYNNPLTPLFHLSTLVIHAPGASLVLPMMDTKKAYQMQKLLGHV